MPPRYYLGVDGGQSSTTALIANETGRVMGRGTGGPCNHVSGAEGKAKFFAAVGGCVQGACDSTGIDPAAIIFASACLGFSGGAEDKNAYTRELIRSKQYKITHDAEIALSGAVAAGPGIIAIAGSGSMTFGRNSQGKTARAGGWGYIYGDEGGSFDLTRRALRAALEQEEGWGPTTQLLPLLLTASGAKTANELLHRFYAGVERSAIGAYAPLVTEAAQAGDAVARTIISEAAEGLARYVRGVHRQLFDNHERVRVAYIGGVFRSEPLRKGFTAQIQESFTAEVGPPEFGPAAGALLEALRADGNMSILTHLPESEK